MLDSTLNKILSKVLAEVENPAVGEEVGGMGHIEGNLFPKTFMEELVSCRQFFFMVAIPFSISSFSGLHLFLMTQPISSNPHTHRRRRIED